MMPWLLVLQIMSTGRGISSYWGIHYFGSGFVSPSLRNNVKDINLIMSD